MTFFSRVAKGSSSFVLILCISMSVSLTETLSHLNLLGVSHFSFWDFPADSNNFENPLLHWQTIPHTFSKPPPNSVVALVGGQVAYPPWVESWARGRAGGSRSRLCMLLIGSVYEESALIWYLRMLEGVIHCWHGFLHYQQKASFQDNIHCFCFQ